MAAMKINTTKITNANVVRGHSYENFYAPKFIKQKFVNTKISRSTVLGTSYKTFVMADCAVERS